MGTSLWYRRSSILYSFTCEFLVWMQRPHREELQGRPLSPSAECRIEDLLYQREVCLHHRTCIERMCACTSGLVASQFRQVHKNKMVFTETEKSDFLGRDVVFKQSIELFNARLVHPPLQISILN